MSEMAINADLENFEKEVLSKSKGKPVLVDFWASWCGPCRILGPTLDDVAKKHEGKFHLVKVNVDENPELSQKYSVMSIPSVKLFKDGEIVDEFVGAVPGDYVENFLSTHM